MQRSWLRWATWSVVAFSAIAAIALTFTVLVARAGMTEASALLVRGEGDHLLATVHDQLRGTSGPPTARLLEGIVAASKGEGLRYLSIREAEQGDWIRAGTSTLDDGTTTPGYVRIVHQRARMVERLPLPGGAPGVHLPPGDFGLPDDDSPFPPPHSPPPWEGASSRLPPLIVIEFEAPVVAHLAESVDRTAIAGSIAVIVLIAAAFVLARYLARQTEAARRAALDQRLVSLGEMSAVMAHELRNPIASLKGNAQLLLETLDATGREHEKASRVVREAERLERLTTDLLDFVRDAPMSPSPVAPRDLLARALAGMARDRIDVDDAGAPTAIYVDEARIGGALANLVRNALQAISKDGRVRIAITTHGTDLHIDVRDQGPGLPEGTEERIFEPFFTTQVRGTGLGLAVARRAIEQHGGTLRGETHPDGGALFSIVIPGVARSGETR